MLSNAELNKLKSPVKKQGVTLSVTRKICEGDVPHELLYTTGQSKDCAMLLVTTWL